jgi:hypothetical protein
MIFLAITPKGLSDALASAGKDDHVWCGREAVPAEQSGEMLKRNVTIFSYAFTGLNAQDDLQGAVRTMEEHHPGHSVWVERISTE